MVVSSAPSRPSTAAKAWRDSSTASRSVACFRPTEPSATVEKPWTKPRASASSGMCRAAGVVLTTRYKVCRKGASRGDPGPVVSVFSTLCGPSAGDWSGAAGAQYLLDLALDLLEVHELPVDGGEADVCDLVQVAQPLHDHLADLPARDLDPA